MRRILAFVFVVAALGVRAQVVLGDSVGKEELYINTVDMDSIKAVAVDSIGDGVLYVDTMAVDTAAIKAVSDSLMNVPLTVQDEKELYDKKAFWKPDPIRAMWLGMVVPGLGQIYNRKYWKLPIIYGGFLGCIYALTWNAQMLADYNQAYLDIMDSDPQTKSYEKMLPIGYDITGKEARFQEIFKNRKNTYRRYRDLSIFVMIGIYALSVVDAYIDAELSTFDISRDLSLRIIPTSIEHKGMEGKRIDSSPALGCQLLF